MQCPRCEGTGRCSECGGQGWIPCIRCEGRGELVSPRSGSYPCRSCQGSGKNDCSTSCSSCEGSGSITAELQRKVRDKYEVRFQTVSTSKPVTLSLMALCIGVYIVGALSPPAGAWIDATLSNISGLWTSQPWRLISSVFVHGGLLHLVFNVLALQQFGSTVESLYGGPRFFLLYTLSGVTGGLLSSWGNMTLGGGPVLSVGASGALFGLVGALCACHFRHGLFTGAAIRDQLIWIATFTLVSLVAAPNSLDHWCHLGGFLGGFAYAWVSRRPTRR